MRLSLNEIQTTAVKAAMGAGLPLGLAEEAGFAAGWLSARRLPGVRLLLEGLRALKGQAPGLTLRQEGAEVRLSGSASALYLAPALGDAIRSYPLECFRLEEVARPLLCLPQVARIAESGWDRFVVEWSGGKACFDERSALLEGENAPGPLTVRRWEEGEKPPAGSAESGASDLNAHLAGELDRGISVEGPAWQGLKELAARRLVPASTGSRSQGAGAGSIDND